MESGDKGSSIEVEPGAGGRWSALGRWRRPELRWIELALLAFGLVCVGIYAWAALDARIFQALSERRLQGAVLPPREQGGPAAAERGVQAVPANLEIPEVGDGEPIGRMVIPRLGVSVVVAEGISGKTLRRAVGHIPGTPLPGTGSNVGVAGHRDSFFRPLKDIQEDDTILLATPWGTFHYVVESTAIVGPEDVEVLDATPEPTLTLVTCYPFYYVGSAPKRFIVQARQVGFEQPAG